ncbi:hypothetical protein PG987_011111 [Apiospora arundinis]
MAHHPSCIPEKTAGKASSPEEDNQPPAPMSQVSSDPEMDNLTQAQQQIKLQNLIQENTRLEQEQLNLQLRYVASIASLEIAQAKIDDTFNKRIWERFALLVSDIKSACKSLVIHDPSQTYSEKYRLWMETASGIPLPIAWDIGQESPEEFLRSLLTAHIFHDVLTSTFPADHLGLDVPMVKFQVELDVQQSLSTPTDGETYIVLMMFGIGGLRVARIRERDTTRHIMESDWLDGEAKVASRDLAREAVKILGAIASSKVDNNTGQRFSVVMPPEVAAGRLAPAYYSALKLKAALVLTSKQYAAQFTGSGQEVNETFMDIEGYVQGNRGNRGVKLCVFPIIRISSPSPETDEDKPLVSYQNLRLTRTQKDVTGELLQKGLVWV